MAPVLTAGVAMHPIVAVRYGANVSRFALLEKAVADWWLLARSFSLVVLGNVDVGADAVFVLDLAPRRAVSASQTGAG